MTLCREMFSSNLIATDFDNIQVLEITNADFPQQPNGSGLNISFSVSWHAIGKISGEAHDALSVIRDE